MAPEYLIERIIDSANWQTLFILYLNQPSEQLADIVHRRLEQVVRTTPHISPELAQTFSEFPNVSEDDMLKIVQSISWMAESGNPMYQILQTDLRLMICPEQQALLKQLHQKSLQSGDDHLGKHFGMLLNHRPFAPGCWKNFYDRWQHGNKRWNMALHSLSHTTTVGERVVIVSIEPSVVSAHDVIGVVLSNGDFLPGLGWHGSHRLTLPRLLWNENEYI